MGVPVEDIPEPADTSAITIPVMMPYVRRINHAYAHTALKPLLPALLLGKKVMKQLSEVLRLIAKQTYVHRLGRSKPRNPGAKSHSYMTQKHR